MNIGKEPPSHHAAPREGVVQTFGDEDACRARLGWLKQVLCLHRSHTLGGYIVYHHKIAAVVVMQTVASCDVAQGLDPPERLLEDDFLDASCDLLCPQLAEFRVLKNKEVSDRYKFIEPILLS